MFPDKMECVLINPKNSPTFEDDHRLISEFKKKYHDSVIYKTPETDPGLYNCWNMGIKLCTGEYIGNANLDDRMSNDSVEKKAKELFLNEDVDLVYSDMFITEKLNETFEINSSNGRKYNFPEFSFENLKRVNMPHAAPLYRKELHDKFGYFNGNYGYAADWDFHLRCAQKNTKQKKIHDVLGLYCFNPEGVSTDPSRFPEKHKEEKEIFEHYKDLQVEYDDDEG